MGKRYGRNQRRKHREHIAELQRDVEDAAAERRLFQGKAERLQRQLDEWGDEIRHLLGSATAFSPVTEELRSDHFPELYPIPAEAVWAPHAFDAAAMPAPVRLINFLAEVSPDDRQMLRRLVRLRLSNGEQWAYAVSEDLLLIEPFNDEMQRHLAHTIARELSVAVRAKYARQGGRL